MEVLKELAKMYFDRRCFPDKGTTFLENVRPLESPRNTRSRSAFSLKPLVRNTHCEDQKSVGWTPLNLSPTNSTSSQDLEGPMVKRVGSKETMNVGAVLATPLREQLLSQRKQGKTLRPRTQFRSD